MTLIYHAFGNIVRFCDAITLTEKKEIDKNLKLGKTCRLPVNYIATTLFLLGHRYFYINEEKYGDDEEVELMGSFNYSIDESDSEDD
jgi:hypothetical protein